MSISTEISHISITNIIYRFFKIGILLLYLDSMYPWYTWNNSVSMITRLLCLFLFITLYLNGVFKPKLKNGNKTEGLFVLLYFICTLIFWRGSYGLILPLLIFLGTVFLQDEIKIDLFKFILKWFSILLIISTIIYILNFMSILPLPHTIIQYDDGRYVSENYIFFLKYYHRYFLVIPRFMSIFMEPGHMTMGIIPLIMATRFDIRNKYVLFLLIAELLSFSLAGYICLVIGYLVINLKKGKLKYIVGAIIFVGSAIWLIEKNESSNIIDHYIWSRLEFSESGSIVGDNRTHAKYDKIYNDLLSSDDVFLGKPDIDRDQGDGGNAGYKVYVVKSGLIGLLLIILMYSNYFFYFKDKYIRILIIINLLLLSQSGGPLWYCCFASYVFGVTYLRNCEKKESSTSLVTVDK